MYEKPTYNVPATFSRQLIIGKICFPLMVLLLFSAFVSSYSQSFNLDQIDEIRATLNGDMVYTDVVGLDLQGNRFRDHLVIEDFGIINGENKYLPILYMLEILDVSIDFTGDTIYVNLPSKKQNVIVLQQKIIKIGNNPVEPLDYLVGRSDLSEKVELFFKGTDCSRLLSMSLEWDENRYLYSGRTEEAFPVFKKFDLATNFDWSQSAMQAHKKLPEKLSPARPGFSSDYLTFLQTTLYGTAAGFGLMDPGTSFNRSNPNIYYRTQAQVDLWGRLFSGNYHIEIGKNYFINSEFYDPPPLYYEGNWETFGSKIAATLGDQSLGMGELIFPSISLRGVVATVGAYNQDSVQPHSRYSSSNQKIEGYAPAQSTVKLFINGRPVEEQKTRPDPKAPVGQERYRFRNANLLQNQVNDVRIVISNQSGYHEEIHKEVIGSRNNLSGGQIKFTSGVGTRRISSTNVERMHGLFSGGSLSYGLTNDITLGVMGAMQRDFNVYSPLYSFGSGSRVQVPEQSEHMAGNVSIRLLSHLLLSTQIAASRSDPTQYFRYGNLTSLKTHIGNLRCTLSAYRLEPDYFDGINSLFQNQDGLSVNTWWRPLSRMSINYLYGLGGDYAGTWESPEWKDRFSKLQFQFYRLPLFQRLRLATIRRDIAGFEVENLYDAEGEIRFFRLFRLRGRWTVGDAFQSYQGSYFLQKFGLTSIIFAEDPGKRLNLYFDPNGPWSASVNYYDSEFYKSALLAVSRQNWLHKGLSFRLEMGKNWNMDRLFGRGQFDYALDSRGQNRISLSGYLDNNNWSAQVSFQLQNIFGLHYGRMQKVQVPRFTPDNGGIWGHLFLDKNGNGYLDNNEPGLESIPVILESQFPKKVETDKNGIFYFPTHASKDSMRVSIDIDGLPAIYIPTNGTQLVHVEPGAFTPAMLGVARFVEINGTIKVKSVVDLSSDVIRGIRMCLIRQTVKSKLVESISAENGSFYFGDLLPGDYFILIDPRTIDRDVNVEILNSQPRTIPESFEWIIDILDPKSRVTKKACNWLKDQVQFEIEHDKVWTLRIREGDESSRTMFLQLSKRR